MRVAGLAVLLILLAAFPTVADTVTGTVLDPDGKPVAGAEVYLDPTGSPDDAVTLHTDVDGSFTAELSPHEFDPTIYGWANIMAPGLALGGGLLRRGETEFRLERAGQAWGSVTDRDANPVAGARVIPVAIYPVGGDPTQWGKQVRIRRPWQERFAVKTSADGRWTMFGLPRVGMVTVQLEDPRFVESRGQARLGVEAPGGAPMVAIPGAVFLGKVVDGNGAPAEGVRVFAQGQQASEGWSEDTTAADGSYALGRLPAGVYNVMAEEKTGAWVAVAVSDVALKEGETATVRDLVLTAGGLVEGRATDANTGEPIPGARIGSYGPHRPRSSAAIIGARTDEHGRYRLRVAPGKSYIYISDPSPDYLREDGAVDLVVGLGETKTADFRLKRGVSFLGKVRDEQDHPVEGAFVELQPIDVAGQAMSTVGRSDEAGDLVVRGLAPGAWGLVVRGEWELIAPGEVAVPAVEPVRVTVARPAPKLNATGRVLALDGGPLVGVTVAAAVRTPEEQPQWGPGRNLSISVGSTGQRRMVTDVRGEFTLSGLLPSSTAQLSARLPGYKQISGGEVRYQEGAFSISDIVLAELRAKLTGQVVDAAGRPAAGAIVMSPDGGEKAHTRTDATGQFVLSALPEGEVQLLAAHDHSFAQTRGRADGDEEPALITLSPRPQVAPGDVKLAYDILARVWRESEEKDYYARGNLPGELAPYDPDLALQLARTVDGSISDEALSGIPFMLTEARPLLAAEWAPSHLAEVKPPRIRGMVAAHLGLAVVSSHPDLARRLYQEAKLDLEKAGPAEEAWPGDLAGRSMLVPLAGLLGEPGAEAMLTTLMADAVRTAHRLGSEDRGLVGAVAQGVARGGPKMAEQALALSGLTGSGLMSALAGAVTEVGKHDPEAAVRLLAGVAVPTDGTEGHYYAVAVKALIEVIGPRNPARAVALARGVGLAIGEQQRAQALALAAQYQPEEMRRQVFAEAVQAAQNNANLMAWIAALAYRLDAGLGAELFTEARAAVTGDLLEPTDNYAPFAFYYAQVNPAAARMMIESHYRKAQAADSEPPFRSRLTPILAMAAVDVDRALEMARALPDSEPNARFDTQRKIAQYVLAPESVRRTMPFDRWTASDTWMPGTPSEW